MLSSQNVTDSELDRLGSAGALWPLLDACTLRLADDPQSSLALLYRSAALLGLGVGELAADSLGELRTDDADAIRAAAKTSSSVIAPVGLVRTCRENINALGDQAPSLRTAFDTWSAQHESGGRRLYRCDDGNVFRVHDGGIELACNTLAAAQHADLGMNPPVRGSSVNEWPGMLVVAGCQTPWLLQRVLREVGDGVQGYRPRVYVVETADPFEVLDALSMVDLREELSTTSTRWLLGSGAEEKLRGELHSLWKWKLPTSVISPTPSPEVRETVEAALENQRERAATLMQQCETPGRGRRSRSYWCERFEDAQRGTEPLRVLLISTRYTTYIKHAMEALAGALDRAGHTPTILVEPANDLRPASTLELSAHAEFDPDITICANWPRSSRSNAWPEGAPAVCWVQDTLGSLLDPRHGSAQGDVDFFVGLINGAMIRDFGFEKRRSIFQATPACPETFFWKSKRRALPEIDVAYISHQSEPYSDMLKRMVARAASDSERSLVSRIGEEIVRLFTSDDVINYAAAEQLTARCIHDTLGREDVMVTSRLLQILTLPLAERLHRHTMIDWALRVCERNGLTLGLFGNGWENTPYSAHARGPVLHGDALRELYHSSGCHLHASLQSNAHQRVAECALSGGLMLRRGPSPDTAMIQQIQQQVLAHQEPDFERAGFQGYLVSTSDDPLKPDCGLYDPVRLASLTGIPLRPAYIKDEKLIRPDWIARETILQSSGWLPSIPLEYFPDWAYDNAVDTLFSSENELECMLVRGARDPEWRECTIEHHHERALAFHTTDVFCARMITAIRDELAESAPVPR